jgi:tetratricopeptide (TPR) repeat protein
MAQADISQEASMFCPQIALRKWVGFALLLAAMAFAVPVYAQTGGLEGNATLQDGTPCVKCIVMIERQDIKGNYPVKTDKKGHYVYVGLPIGQYKVTLQDPNGKPIYNFNGLHIGLGDPTQRDFDLKKLAAEDQKTQMANPEVQKKLEEINKEQKQSASLKSLFDQGQALYGDKKYAEAAASFEQAVPLAKDRNLVAVLNRLADSYDKAHQFDKAVDTYQKVIALSPTDGDLHNALGNTYAEMGKTPDALAEFQKSAEINPAGASKAYFNLGAILYNTGKMDDAAAAFKKATDADPKYADAYALMGRALMGKVTLAADGKTVIAPPGTVEAFQTYLKLDPNGTYAAEAQGDLQAIQGGVQTEYKVDKKKKK